MRLGSNGDLLIYILIVLLVVVVGYVAYRTRAGPAAKLLQPVAMK